jgi:hypothetical protein
VAILVAFMDVDAHFVDQTVRGPSVSSA